MNLGRDLRHVQSITSIYATHQRLRLAEAFEDRDHAILTIAIPAKPSVRNAARRGELQPTQQRVVFRDLDLPAQHSHGNQLFKFAKQVGAHSSTGPLSAPESLTLGGFR